ncbi:MAG: ABC transporter ATP-binding protein [Armatimonadota bacterium]|nr:MAG: ABC transporter ATP-binding protein [Armatimonadota bacterium]
MADLVEEGLSLKARLRGSFEDAIHRVREAFASQGFGVLTEIDVQDTLKQKIGADFHRYVILGTCNPGIAHRALSAVPEVGLLLPCNVCVYEDGDEVVVSALNPEKALQAVGSEELRPMAEEAGQRIRRAMASM